MGYSLYFVRVPEGTREEDVGALVRALTQAEEDDAPDDPEAAARNEALVAALLAVDPTLERDEYDFQELARWHQISEAAARRRFRTIDLSGSADGHRIGVTLHDAWASTEMPYGASPGGADDLAALRRIARVLVHQGGYVAYDPIGSQLLDVDDDAAWSDAEAAPRDDGSPSATRPWWRFW
jgi:hypothetical protein